MAAQDIAAMGCHCGARQYPAPDCDKKRRSIPLFSNRYNGAGANNQYIFLCIDHYKWMKEPKNNWRMCSTCISQRTFAKTALQSNWRKFHV